MKFRCSSYCHSSIFEVWFSIGDNEIYATLLPLKQVDSFIRCSRLKVSVICWKFLSSGVILKYPNELLSADFYWLPQFRNALLYCWKLLIFISKYQVKLQAREAVRGIPFFLQDGTTRRKENIEDHFEE